VRKAAEELHVSQPSISAQLRLLEDSLGEKLFKRTGRNLVLSEMGELVLTYADEIFSSGRDLISAVKARSGGRTLRLNVGMTDALSKFIGFQILKPAFYFAQPVHVVCRQAAIAPLVNQLQAHRLDLVLADEPASSSLKAKTFNHRLGQSGVTFCAVSEIAKKLRRNFPKSLHQAPALLPSENMGMREPLEKWFYSQGIRPRLVAEFEDAGLMKVAASAGLGFTMVHSVVDKVALEHFGLRPIARVKECASDFYAITIERRLKHPVVAAITEHAYSELFA
jgi:LysR family transcriptional activator of nhaA